MRSKMRVLHFAPRVCWPLDTGAKLRNYHLARQISRFAQISLLAFSENGEGDSSDDNARELDRSQVDDTHDAARMQRDESQAEPLLVTPERFYERVITVHRDPAYTLSKIVRGAIGRTPLPVLNYTTLAMKRELARILDRQDFDVIQVESVHLLAYLPIIRSARASSIVICDWHNIESELMWRYSERAMNPLRRIYARRASKQMDMAERRALREFDAHVVVSDRDSGKLKELLPDASVFLIENGVDTAYYSDVQIKQSHAVWGAEHVNSSASSGARDDLNSAEKGPRRLSFVGSMDYHANVDAALYFAKEVWPQVHQERPELIFTIVGRDPGAEVRQLAEIPGIEVTGTVDDVRPYYYESVAAIIPLRVGGGSRLKILEAMASGVPVVSTRLGAEGLDVRDGENIAIGETPSELHRLIVSLLTDEQRRRALVIAGRELVAERYDWSRLGSALYQTYQSLLESQSSRPNAAILNS